MSSGFSRRGDGPLSRPWAPGRAGPPVLPVRPGVGGAAWARVGARFRSMKPSAQLPGCFRRSHLAAMGTAKAACNPSHAAEQRCLSPGRSVCS